MDCESGKSGEAHIANRTTNHASPLDLVHVRENVICEARSAFITVERMVDTEPFTVKVTMSQVAATGPSTVRHSYANASV